MHERQVGLREQLAHMKLRWPLFESRIRHGVLNCRGELTPGSACATYSVSVSYRCCFGPEVRVLSPELARRPDGKPIPHMYEQDKLCLYYPGGGEWTAKKLIATTIIPWTSLWLYFYEVWRATGEWLGGGEEPCVIRPYRRMPRSQDND